MIKLLHELTTVSYTHLISGISVCGVALATLALVCTLSVFNGFQDMVAGFFTAFDPELKIKMCIRDSFHTDVESSDCFSVHFILAGYVNAAQQADVVDCKTGNLLHEL